MSGHSKWHQIKHKKAQTDSEKSKVFGRLAREIQIAARAGQDPATNAALREAIARAKKANMPQQNLDRLIGTAATDALTEVIYEGFGPGGVSLLITTQTDNPNRTVAEIRTILKKQGGSLGTPGSVRWKFSTVTHLTATLSAPAETLLEQLIDAGAEDITTEHTTLQIRASTANVLAIRTILEENNASSIETQRETQVLPEHQRVVTRDVKTQVTALCNELNQHQDVQSIATDLI